MKVGTRAAGTPKGAPYCLRGAIYVVNPRTIDNDGAQPIEILVRSLAFRPQADPTSVPARRLTFT